MWEVLQEQPELPELPEPALQALPVLPVQWHRAPEQAFGRPPSTPRLKSYRPSFAGCDSLSETSALPSKKRMFVV